MPATRELLSLVSGLPEMRGRDALKELARVGPQRKFDLLVEQAMEGFGLTFNVPARDRKRVRDRIRTALEAHVERNLSWLVPSDPTRPGKIDTLEPHALSTIMGKQMGMELLRQLHAEGERVHMELPEGWRHELGSEELQVATQLINARGFTGYEARGALASWVAIAAGRLADLRTVGADRTPVSRSDRWLHEARKHGRRATPLRLDPVVRGMSR